MFVCEICEIFKSNYFEEHLWTTLLAMKYWKSETRDYHQKLNVRVASQIANDLRLRILGNKRILQLFSGVFMDWMILELVDLNSNSWIWTRTFEFQLVLLSFQPVTCNSWLVFYHIAIIICFSSNLNHWFKNCHKEGIICLERYWNFRSRKE